MMNHYHEQNLLLQKQITEERNFIEIERAKLKNNVEAELDENLEKVKLQAQNDAESNIEHIERNIHHENEKLSQKTMAQRNTLEYYKKQKYQGGETNKVFKRNMQLNMGAVDEYEQRGKQQ
jgi:hypothetical protein